MFLENSRHCGERIFGSPETTSGWFISPGYPGKYNKDLICDWEIVVREGYKVLKTISPYYMIINHFRAFSVGTLFENRRIHSALDW